MSSFRISHLLLLLGCIVSVGSAGARERGNPQCVSGPHPQISFVEIQSLNLAVQPPAPLTVKGKLQLPVRYSLSARCFTPKDDLPAVVILHGSAGVDSRGDFYAEALNAVGIATLEIDMWEARDVTSPANRPKVPILTYPDAFAALKFLAQHDHIAADRIGVLGFSWGGVMALASAEQLYAGQFGGGLRFAAHVAHYPVCYGANNSALFQPLSAAAAGAQLVNLTGAPLLIQIGTEDDYDNGAQHCQTLAQQVASTGPVDVEVYQGAYHGWDRLQVPITAQDPYADEGSIFRTGVAPAVKIVPDVEQAYRSRNKVTRFFFRHL